MAVVLEVLGGVSDVECESLALFLVGRLLLEVFYQVILETGGRFEAVAGVAGDPGP